MKHARRLIWRNRRIAYGFLLPNLLGFLLFTLVPVVAAFVLGTMQWDGAHTPTFVGLGNFERLLRDSSFRIAFGNTLLYTFLTVPCTAVVSLLLAVVLNSGLRGQGVYRAIHFIPYISSLVAVSVVWLYLYHPQLGPLNRSLRLLGVQNPPAWLSSVTWALPAVALMNIWKNIGYYMIIFLAGLQAIPRQLYEAARIDGAGTIAQFRRITVPQLSHTIFFVFVIATIVSFKAFDQIYVMTSGGPGRASTVLVYVIFMEAFVHSRLGYASAISIVLFLMVLAFTLAQFRAYDRRTGQV